MGLVSQTIYFKYKHQTTWFLQSFFKTDFFIWLSWKKSSQINFPQLICFLSLFTCFSISLSLSLAQSARALEYTDYTSAEG